MEYAKAYAGAVTAILVFAIAHVGLELPEEITASLELLVTGGIVWFVKNHQPATPEV